MNDNEQLGKYWMIFAGVSLIGAGLLGFLAGNPIASQDPAAIFRVNAAHNLVHLLTGALALAIAYGTRGVNLANGLIGFGALYAVVAVLLLIDSALFGLFADAPSNAGDMVLHVALAVVSLALGYMLRQRTGARGAVR